MEFPPNLVDYVHSLFINLHKKRTAMLLICSMCFLSHLLSHDLKLSVSLTRITAQSKPASCADSDGGTGGPDPPLKNHKNIWFLCNTDPDPQKNHKATKPAFNVGPSSARQQNAI